MRLKPTPFKGEPCGRQVSYKGKLLRSVCKKPLVKPTTNQCSKDSVVYDSSINKLVPRITSEHIEADSDNLTTTESITVLSTGNN